MDFEAAEFATDAESAIDAGAFAARAEDTDGDPEIDLAPGPVMGAASGPEAKVARDPDALDPPLAPAVAWNEVWRLVTIHPPMASRAMKAPMMGQRYFSRGSGASMGTPRPPPGRVLSACGFSFIGPDCGPA